MPFLALVTDIWEELAASNSGNSLPSNKAFHLKDTSYSDILSSPTIYHVTTHFFFNLRLTKAMYFLSVSLFWHTANLISPHTVKHTECKCLCYLPTSFIRK